MTESASTIHTVQMSVRQWSTVDAVLDNEMSSQAQSGDPASATAFGFEVRQTGWDQLRDRSDPDRQITVALTRQQWQWLLTTLVHWATIASRAGDEAGDLHEIAALVRAQVRVS